MGLPWLWLIGGAVVGPLFGLFFKVWNKLDDQTKKLIIETVVNAFEEILRAYYNSNKLDDQTKKLIIETVVNAFEEILRAYYNWWKQKGESA